MSVSEKNVLARSANARTSKKSLIFEMHCGVYEHTGKQRYSTYRQEEYDT